MVEEEWRPISGFEGLYEVSNHGRVRSLDRVTKTRKPRHVRGRVLSTGPNNLGYPQVTILDHEAKRHQKLVHSLVADAFLEKTGPLVRHLDDVKTNNHVSNLAFGTYSDNNYDAVRNGSHPQANKTHCPRNHPYTSDNLMKSATGQGRKCRTCKADMDRRYRANRNTEQIERQRQNHRLWKERNRGT